MVRRCCNRSSHLRRALPSQSCSRCHVIDVCGQTYTSQWFGTYNYLEDTLPVAHTVFQTLMRRAFIGFVASVVSDSVSNSLRVIKTYRQVNEIRVGYWEAAKAVIATDGLSGLLGRGLKTRILANGLQGLIFSVLWRFFMDL